MGLLQTATQRLTDIFQAREKASKAKELKQRLLDLSYKEQPWPEDILGFSWFGAKEVKKSKKNPFGMEYVFKAEMKDETLYVGFEHMDFVDLDFLTGRPEFNNVIDSVANASAKNVLLPSMREELSRHSDESDRPNNEL